VLLLIAVVAAGSWLSLAARTQAIITADGYGTHETTPGQPFTRQGSAPLNTDGVVQIFVDTQTFGGENIEYTGSGALISDRHVLTAAHLLTIVNAPNLVVQQQIDLFGTGSEVRFDLAGAGGDQFVPIAGVSLHPDYFHPFIGYDIAVIELAQDAPASVPRYPIYTGDDEFELSFFVKSGYGQAGWGGDPQQRSVDNRKRAGFNAYEASELFWAESFAAAGLPNIYFLPEGTGLVYDFDNGFVNRDALGSIGVPGAGYGADEVFPSVGDSGSPGFILDPETMSYHVAGVTSFGTSVRTDFNFPFNDGTYGETALDTRVSAVAEYIQDVVSGAIPTVKARILDNGGTWVAEMDSELDHHVLRIADSTSGTPTTLEIRDGAIVGTDDSFPSTFGIELLDTSSLTMTGGELRGSLLAVRARDSSTVEVYDGMIRNPNTNTAVIELDDSSTARIDGGTIGGTELGAIQFGNSALTVTGGSITGEHTGVRLFDAATLTITGGSIIGESSTGIAIGPDTMATVMIHGGTISGGVDDLVNNSPQSRIQIYGREESFILPLGEVTAESGNITGVFADGTPFDFSFFRGGGGGIIELVAAAAGIPGDYNSDGTVDAADYVVWRKNVGGPAGTLPNDPDGGAIGSAQYNTWRANFGVSANSAESPSLPGSVPEPASAVLLILAAAAIFDVRRESE
jgi:hypothetical protein